MDTINQLAAVCSTCTHISFSRSRTAQVTIVDKERTKMLLFQSGKHGPCSGKEFPGLRMQEVSDIFRL